MYRIEDIYNLYEEGELNSANQLLFEYMNIFLEQKRYMSLFEICKKLTLKGYSSKFVINTYAKLLQVNPFFYDIEIIDIFRKQKKFKELLISFNSNLSFLNKMNINDIDKGFLIFLITAIENKNNFSLIEYKFVIKVMIEISIIHNNVNINYIKILKNYFSLYEKENLKIFLRAFS